MKSRTKVSVYVISNGRLLVFAHLAHPEVGYQVPSGTVKHGESVAAAAARELAEETGLHVNEGILESLGIFVHDMRPFREELQERHCFLVRLDSAQREKWTHWEEHSETVGAVPERFDFHWEPLAAELPHLLVIGQGAPIAKMCAEDAGGNAQRLEYRALDTTLNDTLSRRRQTQCAAVALLFPEMRVELDATHWCRDPAGALLEHIVYHAQRAVTGKGSLAAVRELLLATLKLKHTGFPLVIRSKDCLKVSDHDYETPLFLATASAVSAKSSYGGNDYETAIRLLRRAGFMHTVEGCAGLAIELADKTLLEASNSYTLSGLRGTLFCDRTDSLVRRAETVLHEATHTWLNIMLAERMPQGFRQGQYWSPWRHKLRPAHGILQATLVFSLLCQFFDRCLRFDEVVAVDKAYARARLRVESGVLLDNFSIISEVLMQVEDTPLRAVVAEELNRALNLISRKEC